MDLRHLRYFTILCEELHFAKAAQRIGIAQPALSIQIKALEDELGAKLLQRNNRNVRITEAGQLFLVEAQRTLEQAEHAINVARRAGRGEIGHLNIDFPRSVAYSGMLASALSTFRQKHPDVDIMPREVSLWDQFSGVLEGRANIAFTSRLRYLKLDIDPDLEMIPLRQLSLMVALPIGHSLAKQKAVSADDLKQEKLIVISADNPVNSVTLIEMTMGFTPRIAQATAEDISSLSLVAAGVGIAVLPTAIRAVNLSDNIVYRPITGIGPVIDMSVIYSKSRREPIVDAFLKSLKETPPTIFSGKKRK
ncbi:LysR substrate-binding domain-containing protein [Microvirga sp. W0021]|uniref:LysR substrate-binding domain-containing protein n=1 Tax=Hohaiivirga grylli TaxID=3133970 RepID=A0ABV0BHG7_9HYPH